MKKHPNPASRDDHYREKIRQAEALAAARDREKKEKKRGGSNNDAARVGAGGASSDELVKQRLRQQHSGGGGAGGEAKAQAPPPPPPGPLDRSNGAHSYGTSGTGSSSGKTPPMPEAAIVEEIRDVGEPRATMGAAAAAAPASNRNRPAHNDSPKKGSIFRSAEKKSGKHSDVSDGDIVYEPSLTNSSAGGGSSSQNTNAAVAAATSYQHRNAVRQSLTQQELTPKSAAKSGAAAATGAHRVDNRPAYSDNIDKREVREQLGIGAVRVSGPAVPEQRQPVGWMQQEQYDGAQQADDRENIILRYDSNPEPDREEEIVRRVSTVEIPVVSPVTLSRYTTNGSGGSGGGGVGGRASAANLDVEALIHGEEKDGDGGGTFCVVCGLNVTRRVCLLITALLLVAVAAVVGALAGTGAFGGGNDGGDGNGSNVDADGTAVKTLGQATTPPPSPGVAPGPTPPPSPLVPPECTQRKLPRAAGHKEEHFGKQVAVDGNTAVVGADMDGTLTASGSVYVYSFENDTGEWKEHARLQASDEIIGDVFGRSVAVSGDTAVFGALSDDNPMSFDRLNSGCAYVFSREPGTRAWVQRQKLLPLDLEEADVSFGGAVAVDGDTVLVGMDSSLYARGVNSGAAYVFERRSDDGTWEQKAKLTPEDGEENDRFGSSVALFGRTAVVGAVRADAKGRDSGAAYVYFRTSGGNWTLQGKLVAEDGAANDAFGRSVSVHRGTVLVGADFDDDNYLGSGSAYVFVRDSGTGEWSQRAKLLAGDDARSGQSFGRSVALHGGTAVVGTGGGAAYVFDRTGDRWTRRTRLVPSLDNAGGDGSSSDGEDRYGESVDLSGDTVIIGAHADSELEFRSGTAYVLKLC